MFIRHFIFMYFSIDYQHNLDYCIKIAKEIDKANNIEENIDYEV